MKELVGSETADPAKGTLLDRARSLADGSGGREPVAKAIEAVHEWQQRHAEARAADDSGYYDQALPKVIGEKDSTGEYFDRVDTELRRALAHEQDDFRHSADDGRGALTGLAAGAAVLAVLGGGGRGARHRAQAVGVPVSGGRQGGAGDAKADAGGPQWRAPRRRPCAR
ncbi:hypothetical protein GCM10020000_53980 [Streptomyces olivoverticillatus]